MSRCENLLDSSVDLRKNADFGTRRQLCKDSIFESVSQMFRKWIENLTYVSGIHYKIAEDILREPCEKLNN